MTALQAEIDKCFFRPQTEDDLSQIADNLYPWLERAHNDFKQGNLSEALEISLFILDEIGFRFEADEYYCCFDDLCSTDDSCRQAAFIITQIMKSDTTSSQIKEQVLKDLKKLTKHTSFDNYGHFDLDAFIRQGATTSERPWLGFR